MAGRLEKSHAKLAARDERGKSSTDSPVEQNDSSSPDNDTPEERERIAAHELRLKTYEPSESDDSEPPSTPPPSSPFLPKSQAWPVLGKAAYIGPLGIMAQGVEPHTEADPAAILFQGLIGFGNLIGHKAYFPHEADRHYGNEYLVLVGDTAAGRKGTSWGHARRILAAADPEWASDRIVGGLSSGEGLIHEVRDPLRDDAGVTDKRLMVLEAEFASVLKVIERQGNNLSPVLRAAWEGGTLRTLTKNTPAKSTDSHISVIGHITSSELQRCLTATEVGNGLGNRHLFVCVRRSKFLPEGGTPDQEFLERCSRELATAASFARNEMVLWRDDSARELWRAEYPRLSGDRPGLVGSMAARCLAHVCRLSMLYALSERQHIIGVRHLRAGIACWDYCEASLRYIFGTNLGDPIADEIREELCIRPDGMTRTDIRDHFGRSKKVADIERALNVLQRWNVAKPVRGTTSKVGGKPAVRWVATGQEQRAVSPD
jgi:hypothetical protein